MACCKEFKPMMHHGQDTSETKSIFNRVFNWGALCKPTMNCNQTDFTPASVVGQRPHKTPQPCLCLIRDQIQRPGETLHGALRIVKLLQTEQAEAKGPELGWFVTLQRHAGGRLQADRKEFFS